MPTEFTMPKLGLTMEEGTVVRWLASEGEPVKAGQVILEVQTDKVTVEVEAPVEGVLGTPLVAEGQTVPVGALLAWIADSGTSHARQPEARPSRHFSSPRARKQAREAGVDWRTLSGSGPSGRVIERDVAVERERPDRLRPPTGLAQSVRSEGETVRWETPTAIQRAAAERTTAAFTSVPHFYLTAEASAEALAQVREGLLPAVERRAGVRLTFTDLLVKIVATALLEHPRANAFWQDGRIGVNTRINIAIATATEGGLVAPVLKAADELSLAQIAGERARLVAAARTGKLTPEDVAGGTFTLSNLGAHRVDQFQPVLNTPPHGSPAGGQSVILAAGRIAARPYVTNGQLGVARTVILTIACDHRVLDGALAAAFFDRLIELVEAPYEILV